MFNCELVNSFKLLIEQAPPVGPAGGLLAIGKGEGEAGVPATGAGSTANKVTFTRKPSLTEALAAFAGDNEKSKKQAAANPHQVRGQLCNASSCFIFYFSWFEISPSESIHNK